MRAREDAPRRGCGCAGWQAGIDSAQRASHCISCAGAVRCRRTGRGASVQVRQSSRVEGAAVVGKLRAAMNAQLAQESTARELCHATVNHSLQTTCIPTIQYRRPLSLRCVRTAPLRIQNCCRSPPTDIIADCRILASSIKSPCCHPPAPEAWPLMTSRMPSGLPM